MNFLVQALECGIGKISGEDVKKTLSLCVKNNETLEKIWEMAASSATPAPDSSDSSSTETEKPKSARMSRVSKRASNAENQTAQDQTTVPLTETTTSMSDMGDACIVQCVFKQLGLTEANGDPDHNKIVEGLLKHATGRELRIFLQESAGECFQQVHEESNLDSCAHSTKLVTCLANKGRMNCEDWPAGNLPF
ncbi:hypothetical protein NQ315_001638 [Exocentrus adspersus]|uniref:Uncharacterized protein n=1 Tax=Exocentrus adspersus TaxID=1586481 RepID=A0AAV8W901_9CUCU|nr:hypothetical protein NQ315_001638 [Exocentrus adspersus]